MNNAAAERWVIDDVQVYGTLNASSPTITVPSGTLTFTTPVGTSSAEQSYAVAGSNLTADIDVAAPAGYQLSATSGSYVGATNTLTLPATGGTVYVRLSGATVGTFNGNITHTSGTASASKAVQGSVRSTTPTISSLAPTSGPVGTVVTLTGTNFSTSTVTSVSFGSTPAASFNIVSPTQLTATVATATPAGAASVTVSDGTTTVTAAQQFTVVATPSISATPNSLSGFNSTQGTPSAAQTYSVQGTGLGNNGINLSTVAGFEIALAAAGPYSTTQTVATNSSGNVPATTIYVRLTGANQGTFTGQIDNNSASVVAGTPVNVSGIVNPAPGLTVTPASLTGFTASVGQTSAVQSYNVTGVSLSAPVVVSAPVGYEVATSVGGPYAATQSLALSGGSVNTTVYVRLSNSNGAGNYAGGVSNVSGAFSQNVTVNGTVTPPANLAAEPTTVGTITFGNITANSIRVTVTAGDGSARLLVVRQGNAVNADPIDGLTYQASPAYGAGSEIGTLNYVVLRSGNASPSVTVTGLTAGTQYFFRLYELNGTGSATNYLTTTVETANATTTAAVASVGTGELYLEEGFDYAQGATLTSTGNWTDIDAGGINSIQTDAGSLSSAMYGTPGSVGYAAALDGTGEDVYRTFSPSFTSGDLYVSFLAQVADASSTGYFLALLSGSNNSTFTGRVFVRSGGSTGTFNFGLNYGSSGNAQYGSVDYQLNTPYLVVLRYTRIGGTNTVRMYVFDQNTPVAEPTTPTVADISGSQTASLNGVLLRQYNASQNITVDGIRVGNGWGAVVGRPRYVDEQFTMRGGNYYDAEINLPSTTGAIALTGPVTIQQALTLSEGRFLTSTTNTLTLAAGATATVGTATSFVDGPLASVFVGSDTKALPIGKNGIYRPLTININQVGTSTYQAEVVNTASPAYALPSNIMRRSMVRYYTLNRTSGTAAATSGQVTITYGDDDGVNDPAYLRVLRSVGSNAYTDEGPTGGGSASPSGTIVSNLFTADFTSQNIFTLGNQTPSTSPLPVELLSFTATRQTSGVQVNWATAAEKNNARFEVQRSADGRAFETIASVQGQGTSTTRHQYGILDKQPLRSLAYYRLRQLDLDGTATFSPVVAVAGTGEVALYPNPVASQLTVSVPSQETSTLITLTDLTGRVVLTQPLPADGKLDLQRLATGTYMLQVRSGAQQFTKRIVKL